MEHIAYKEGYVYQLNEEYSTDTPLKPGSHINTEYIQLTSDGNLTIKKGYAWDGPSGPTIDTLNFMRGSLVHDALYQLMRQSHLDKQVYRKKADKLLQRMCKDDGMSSIRAWWVYKAVRLAGEKAADKGNKKRVIYAPGESKVIEPEVFND